MQISSRRPSRDSTESFELVKEILEFHFLASAGPFTFKFVSSLFRYESSLYVLAPSSDSGSTSVAPTPQSSARTPRMPPQTSSASIALQFPISPRNPPAAQKTPATRALDHAPVLSPRWPPAIPYKSDGAPTHRALHGSFHAPPSAVPTRSSYFPNKLAPKSQPPRRAPSRPLPTHQSTALAHTAAYVTSPPATRPQTSNRIPPAWSAHTRCAPAYPSVPAFACSTTIQSSK